MCGIAGVYGLEKIDQPERVVTKMTDALNHRGPDASGQYSGRNVCLGHRRLSIIDLSEAANQPICSSDGRYALVYNGELYNYKTIKAQLSAYDFKTESDSEVVLAALITWGMKALQLFNGMFAFAFWDNELEKLWIARDRMGIKPLYYARSEQSVFFASEIRALLASGFVDRKLDKDAITDYLRYQCVHAPKTMIQDVSMLMPGTYLEISDNEFEPKDYWKPWQEPHSDQDPIVIQKKIRELLTEAVDKRLVADVPFGAFLSGGIDSSLIVGIISERLGKPLDTFNVSFDHSDLSEAKYAKEIAKTFSTNHHEIKLEPQDFLTALPQALGAMDHPSGDGPNTWIVSKETKKQGITMALSGLGGDELFAGYDVFKRIPYIAERHWILSFPKALRSLAGDVLMRMKPGMPTAKTRELLMADYFDLAHLYPTFRKVLLDPSISEVQNIKALPQNRVFEIVKELETYEQFGKLPTLSRISISEMDTYMQNVLLRDTDQMSMSHALEVRVPFLDHTLVEYVTHVGDGIKYPHAPKKLLIDSFADLLPSRIVDRPKMGFTFPWDDWLRTELKAFAEERLDWLGQTEHFDATSIDALWQRFLKNDPQISWSRIWILITLSDWMKTNNIA